MITGIFHEGSGLGNQLHRYVMTRILAGHKGYDFGMVNSVGFKGREFMNLDMGKIPPYTFKIEKPSGKVIIKDQVKLWEEGEYKYNPEIWNIFGPTVIDGEFQAEEYFGKHLKVIREWLRVEPLTVPYYKCIINFRGGEFVGVPDLFLPQEYWNEAVARVRHKDNTTVFEVHTDDPETAKQFFPHFPIIHDISVNWRSIRFANRLILSNSSFAILPAHLNEGVSEIIAPKFWAGRNIGQWRHEMNNYKKFTYI